jgi:hypothetical protein
MVWVLMHKIRVGMGKLDDKYNLSGAIELDEGYFEVTAPNTTKFKRGRGSQYKTNVAVMPEPTSLEEVESCKIFSLFRHTKVKAPKPP